MKEPRWITELSLVLLHAEALAEHGGREGLRDEGMLQSALARARNLFLYQQVSDIAILAAAYATGIARNHPFVDGNKRAAFLTIGLFLEKNGFELEVSKVNATEVILQLAAGEMDEKTLAAWITGHMKKKESA
ncbi:MAG: type II toxin-antitoxin system death-on-curing family toxin [Actinomycetota bacterium]